ncbi:hypothetical protein SERLA73DRAFT_163437 [Serpula lacrymans var. lacrymans S7.3]|uniref:Xylanolytic transcriptional activator regulatory domain-containing protein n=2 Tax=Serpula lacrymans var. lacrymans TaxID=341189 RepID=F8QDK5_SERL3|nr:uncharacterized protein SERLADRAFT_418667 [Serpula lacrymans var. lacrymans S7.9]EGN93676.1 hypothetical protein SERLA73DRAFT_163437 [Serpula lacrymans var. lacrymans S7.3]EGO19050.1 hypothetical protein SERLADRAFT_418667 [Serpula lacrymans var. lacrymans S7.9]
MSTVPCETCVKRGCGAICPNGSLTSGKGNRLVLANTEELHSKIEGLTSRIRELEDALRIVQAEISDRPHPLLQNNIADLLRDTTSATNVPELSQNDPQVPPSDKSENEAVLDAFGTLTIGTRGETTFLGGTARSEPPLKSASLPITLSFPRLSKPIIDAWLPESDLAPVDHELRKQVFGLLPSLSEAIRLCDIYLEYGQMMWHSISRAELFDELLAGIYRADAYCAVFGLAVKLGYRIGLHLHSARWKLDDSIVQRRSSVFWQLFSLDTWQSFFAGRPPCMSPDWIDCPFPEDSNEVIGENGQKEMSWRIWSCKFTKLLHHVMTTALGSHPPSYSTVLELDRKIRDFPIPPHLRPKCEENIPPPSITFHVQRQILLAVKEATLLNLHRFYFAQALQEQPRDLLKHKYGPSVMAAYRSAWRLIEGHAHAMKALPRIFARINLFWSHSLSAAIVMCMIVTRSPTSSMAASSLRELDVVHDVFRQAAPTSRPAANLLDSITKIWEKGHEAVDYPDTEDPYCLSELDRLGGGKTHLISSPAATPPAVSPPSTASEGDSSSSSQSGWGGAEFPNTMHPRIMQDMRVFDGFEPSPFSAGVLEYTNPESFLQAMSDVQFSGPNIFGSEIYNGQPQNVANFNPQAHQFVANGVGPAFLQDAPVLDSAWQSFVEQLGF